MSRSFYYAKNGKQFGPVPEEEVLRLVGSGALMLGDLVWADGMASWVPITSSEFARYLPIAPGVAPNEHTNGSPGKGTPMSPGAIIAICLGAVLVIGVIAGLASHHRQQQEVSIQPNTGMTELQSSPASSATQETPQSDPAAATTTGAAGVPSHRHPPGRPVPRC